MIENLNVFDFEFFLHNRTTSAKRKNAPTKTTTRKVLSEHGTFSIEWRKPRSHSAAIVFLPAFGSDISGEQYQALAGELCKYGIASILVLYPTPSGTSLSLPEAKLMEIAAQTLRQVAEDSNTRPLFIGGKSQGARIATQVALNRELGIRGVIAISYPILTKKGNFSSKKEDAIRRAHRPMLLISGSNDRLSPIPQLSNVLDASQCPGTIVVLNRENHSLGTRSGQFSPEIVIEFCAKQIAHWISNLSTACGEEEKA